MAKQIECPICHRNDAKEMTDEVDIGVGTQTFFLGIECPDCGQLMACSVCGTINGTPHREWCEMIKEINVNP